MAVIDLNGLAPIRKLNIGMLRQALNTDQAPRIIASGKGSIAEILSFFYDLEDLQA